MKASVQRKRDEGFALLLVIFLTALIALLAVGLTVSVRSHVRLAANTIRSAEAEALADAGVQLAVLSLISGSRSPATPSRFPIDGQPVSCRVDGGATLTLRIQDASGRVNPNLAGDRLLLALFIGLGATRESASRYADTIIDYRDTDSDRRPNGAEQPEYEAAGRPSGPKNASFDTVEELGRVLGMDPSMVAAALPFLTVHSQTAGLDPRTTSQQLAGILARGVEQLPPRAAAAGLRPAGLLPSEFITGSPRRVFLVTSEARLTGGSAFARETVLELQSTRSAVPVFKIWSRGSLGETPSDSGSPVPAC